MKIAFIGTCQVHGMAAVAKRLLPDATVVSYHLNAPHSAEEIASLIAEMDYVITQIPNRLGALSSDSLTNGTRVAKFVPQIAFTGFHPDQFYLFRDGVPIETGAGPYHSQIALGGFLAGLDARRTTSLYNAHVFAELGYFDAYHVAVSRLLRTYQRHGYRLRPILRWCEAAGVVFMHTINHPTLLILERLTVLVLAQLELVNLSARGPADVPDALAESVVSPVFPALARRLRVAGNNTLLLPSPWVKPGATREVPLIEYVTRSFDIYRALDPATLRGSPAEPAIERLHALIA